MAKSDLFVTVQDEAQARDNVQAMFESEIIHKLICCFDAQDIMDAKHIMKLIIEMGIKPEHFKHKRHQGLFRIILDRYNKGMGFDFGSLIDKDTIVELGWLNWSDICIEGYGYIPIPLSWVVEYAEKLMMINDLEVKTVLNEVK